MKRMLGMFLFISAVLMPVFFPSQPASNESFASPPAVGILSKSRNCLACHANNGPWKDDENTVIDIIHMDSKKSFKQADGTFLVEVRRNELKTVRTVIGRRKETTGTAPYRNAWLYIDPKTIESISLSKFAPGWDVNLPGSCRIVGDNIEGYEGGTISVLPMTIRPTDAARDAEVMLQVMLTRGESVKGKGKEGLLGSYFERSVKLRVLD